MGSKKEIEMKKREGGVQRDEGRRGGREGDEKTRRREKMREENRSGKREKNI